METSCEAIAPCTLSPPGWRPCRAARLILSLHGLRLFPPRRSKARQATGKNRGRVGLPVSRSREARGVVRRFSRSLENVGRPAADAVRLGHDRHFPAPSGSPHLQGMLRARTCSITMRRDFGFRFGQKNPPVAGKQKRRPRLNPSRDWKGRMQVRACHCPPARNQIAWAQPPVLGSAASAFEGAVGG